MRLLSFYKPVFAGAILLLVGCSTTNIEPFKAPSTQVLDPVVERRDVQAPKINPNDFEVELSAGFLNIQDFGTQPVVSAKLNYHVSERIFLQGSYSLSSVSDKSYRDFGKVIFETEDADASQYMLSLGYNMMPGEFFWRGNLAIPTDFYFMMGFGNTTIENDNFFTYELGTGLRLLLTDNMAMHVDFKDYIFENDILGDPKWTQNLQFSTGFSFYF